MSINSAPLLQPLVTGGPGQGRTAWARNRICIFEMKVEQVELGSTGLVLVLRGFFTSSEQNKPLDLLES